MAITHFTPRIVGRGNGRSVVAAAAYRHCSRMFNAREASTIDYSRKPGLVHEEFVLPPGAPAWVTKLVADRTVSGAAEAFWNAVEASERRSDAQLAKELLLALPVELTHEQNVGLVRDFVSHEILPRRMVADWVFHHPQGNPHIHLLTSLRPLTQSGFGSKKVALTNPDGSTSRDSAGRVIYKLWAGDRDDFIRLRQAWLDLINRHLLEHGHDIVVDGRSYAERGLGLEPTLHIGPTAKAIDDRMSGAALERIELARQRRQALADRVKRQPSLVIAALASERSVFDYRDIAKWLHRYLDPHQGELASTLTAVLNHPDLVCLQRETKDADTGASVPALYSTRALISLEAEMLKRVGQLAKRRSFSCSPSSREGVLRSHPKLSTEQRSALAHISDEQAITAVVGRAGAGKTTMMAAARELWETSGYRVVGGALAGKAADGLYVEAGIASRTLASWQLSWSKGLNQLDRRTVFVLDEAGMVSSSQMAALVEQVAASGAKLVLVGDPDQLQPIAAGAAFRSLIGQLGFAELQTIYRQKSPWMQTASLALARARVADALAEYAKNGMVESRRTRTEAMTALIANWIDAYEPTASRLILAHRRVDVETLNRLARNSLEARGLIDQGHIFQANTGNRRFAPGDQVVFLRNESTIGVKNGMLGRVVSSAPGTVIVAVGTGSARRDVAIEQHIYRDLEYGYATTIHKSQGATVDHVSILATAGLDRHLTYVAMTRHRIGLRLYHGLAEFHRAGGLAAALGQPNTKLTTLDFADSADYQNAWRYATSRGLHAVRVAETLLHTSRQRLAQQKQRLLEVAARLIRLVPPALVYKAAANLDQNAPLFAPIETFDRSIGETATARLVEDLAVKRAYEAVTARFELVFADRAGAVLRELDLLRSATDLTRRGQLAEKLAGAERLAPLAGQSGLLASPADKQRRQSALKSLAAIPGDVELYLNIASAAWRRLQTAEGMRRQALSTVVPRLSPALQAVLETHLASVGQGSAAFPSLTPALRQEIEVLAHAATLRFGPHIGSVGSTPAQLEDRVRPGEYAALQKTLPLLRAATHLARLGQGQTTTLPPTLSKPGRRL